MAGERPRKLFEKRDQRGAFKSTTAPAADVSNYISGNIDSSSSLGDSSHLYDEQRSFVKLNQADKNTNEMRKSVKPEIK